MLPAENMKMPISYFSRCRLVRGPLLLRAAMVDWPLVDRVIEEAITKYDDSRDYQNPVIIKRAHDSPSALIPLQERD